MPRFPFILRAAICLFGLWPLSTNAQTSPSTPEVFTPENAVLDTSIPFAIGAREAQQDLRSAFGWPTYQEGLVQGVYFRLDPDGYARFSPTTRLDTDVFEVICRPGTVACMGRKDALSVYLGTTGMIEIKLEGVAPGDTFHIADGISETPLPDRILAPLDPPLEGLLAFGGELIFRRGGQEAGRVSLKGFGPVATYLRWISSGQDYAVMPRDWPVPGAKPAEPEVAGYIAPQAPQPQLVYAPAVAPAPVAPAAPAPAPQPAGIAISEAQYYELLMRMQRLELQMAGQSLQAAAPAVPAQPPPAAPVPAAPAAPAAPPIPPAHSSASAQLYYLTDVLGFDLETAALILQVQLDPGTAVQPEPQSVRNILMAPVTEMAPAAPTPAPESPDFMTLSDYLLTVNPTGQ